MEFLEVLNSSAAAIDLNSWQVTGGIAFEFPAGMQIAAGGSLLLVPFDPNDPDNATRVAAFRAQYSLEVGAPLAGGYQGRLSDDGEIVRLRRPVATADNASTVLVLEDEVIFEDTAPWPAANGTGSTLTRVGADALGNLADSWTARDPSPGVTDFTVMLIGDANADGQADQSDLTEILAAGRYLTGQPATLAEGDFNGDGLFDQFDLVAALQSGNFESADFEALGLADGRRFS